MSNSLEEMLPTPPGWDAMPRPKGIDAIVDGGRTRCFLRCRVVRYVSLFALWAPLVLADELVLPPEINADVAPAAPLAYTGISPAFVAQLAPDFVTSFVPVLGIPAETAASDLARNAGKLSLRRQHTFHSLPAAGLTRLSAVNAADNEKESSSMALIGGFLIGCAAASMHASRRSRQSTPRSAKLRGISREALKMERSTAIFTEAQDLMPGGVSSPVRAFGPVGGSPVIFDRAKGAYAWDVDGNRFIDYVCSWGPAILGHADDEVLGALREQLAKGTSFGAPCALENTLAKMVVDAVPSVDMVRFTNSGTEACIGMLRVARAYTKREKFIKFEGCYHGHADPFLVQAGSGVATLGLPDSPGVPVGATSDTLVARYGDLDSVEALLRDHKVAAVVLEAVVGNSGFIKPSKAFLEGLRALTSKYGALLVFDEVMTGFRVSYGGAQEFFGVTPDLTTLGKVIGGGLPVGAYGGRKDIMSLVSPAGPVYQAGTLSGNPLAMIAGIKTLERLRQPGTYEQLDHITGKLVDGILAAARDTGHAMVGGHAGGMFGVFFNASPVNNFTDAANSDTEKFAKWHRMMLERGVYLAPSQFEAGFTSLAHTDADVEHTIAVAREVLSELAH